ncbi:hypothetical protein RD792_004948 [Penstemon davidsonii]|uniref:Protein ECERIFERUM 26-like n=1 Tax=Penstemon davidsonii TaxID=160366 RepID=A0ABR0DIT9_9LAMI|nr:hypothetical protein RD792_004948 [Penstemon davidsonii]
MVMEKTLIYNIKLSSVGPGNVTSPDTIFEPGNIDLAMKLHYLRGIYYFRSQAFEGLNTLSIKEPMFAWLNKFPMTCGRLRRAESGRAYIKCNDCGVRFIEAKCEKTMDEWLEMKVEDVNLEKMLLSNQIIGPELAFSPLVLIQFTKFKCGGMAVGLSWAHVLGDAFSLAEFMNILGRVMVGYELSPPISLAQTPTKSTISNGLPKVFKDPLSIKRVSPVGDNWVNFTKCKMETFSFDVTPAKLNDIQSKLSQNGTNFSPFETLCALLWRCIAKIRGKEFEPKVVTICKKSEPNYNTYGILSNSQVVSVVKANFSILEANTSDLATLVKNEESDERKIIEETMQRDCGMADFIVYGANLTFLNLEEAELYKFEYKGQKPVSVNYWLDGVGEEGAILVLPGPKDGGENGGGGWTITAILPENEVNELKLELKREGLVA